MKRYPDEVAEYISTHVEGTTTKQLTSDLSHVDCKKFKEKLLDEFVLTHADDNGEEQIINVIETGGIGALDYETMYC